jgi:hypothetical protein
MQGYSYQLLVTALAVRPLHLWRFYNQRARAELIIRELKDAHALGKIPARDFVANEAFFQIVLLAYKVLNWFKRSLRSGSSAMGDATTASATVVCRTPTGCPARKRSDLKLGPGLPLRGRLFRHTPPHPSIAAAFLSPGPTTAQVSQKSHGVAASHKASLFTQVSD